MEIIMSQNYNAEPGDWVVNGEEQFKIAIDMIEKAVAEGRHHRSIVTNPGMFHWFDSLPLRLPGVTISWH